MSCDWCFRPWLRFKSRYGPNAAVISVHLMLSICSLESADPNQRLIDLPVSYSGRLVTT